MIYILGFIVLLFIAISVWLVVKFTGETDQYIYRETDDGEDK